LGDVVTSGYFDVAVWNANGSISIPGPEPEAWRWIIGFVCLQGALVLALVLLREAKPLQRLGL
jgi:hypothetical protein